MKQARAPRCRYISAASKLTSDTFRSPNQNKFSERTHACDEVTVEHIGARVTLCGWLLYKRMQFALLRDGFGVTQVVLNESLYRVIENAPTESILRVEGIVVRRPDGQAREDLPTGQVEVVADEITVLNLCKDVPFQPREYQKKTEAVRLKYRYIDLRHEEMQRNLRLRSKMTNTFRRHLIENYGFCEVETPTLFRRTPGGAKEFPVACHSHPHEFYSLTQSPQQFKQLLMIGSIDRYFQIARCYRDEGARPDRQPEFTQVDIEMSFVTMENLMNLLEELMRAVWPSSLQEFPRISYHESMELYGTDKPDLRYDLFIEDARNLLNAVAENLPEGHCIKALRLPGGVELVKSRHLKDWRKAAKQLGINGVSEVIKRGDGSVKSPIASLIDNDQFLENSMTIIAWGPQKAVLRALGKVRSDFAQLLRLSIISSFNPDFKFAWITDFPLFSSDENGKLESEHHPFTAPHDDYVEFLDSDPLRVKSQHFDLILNGWEIGGGSIRIHSSALQRKILADVLGQDCSELEHLLKALDSGAPPHGGFAFGLDRLIAILCEAPSIRDVIAFPKSHDGRDSMANAPVALTQEDLEYFHLGGLKSPEGRDPSGHSSSGNLAS
ncbi:aspartate--tRNA ligase, mitochondrial [Galendromus occidentalis]|uniref:Aspartate--tRNA ligase, mitochondrial n=1 Tax=Galendromus occidentalis TaxID=34638 RepID=A0AAJ7WI44_9ACAR|nr:aspartate--tRNA ligase, mitochondrial [Galendromus occidentalis]